AVTEERDALLVEVDTLRTQQREAETALMETKAGGPDPDGIVSAAAAVAVTQDTIISLRTRLADENTAVEQLQQCLSEQRDKAVEREAELEAECTRLRGRLAEVTEQVVTSLSDTYTGLCEETERPSRELQTRMNSAVAERDMAMIECRKQAQEMARRCERLGVILDGKSARLKWARLSISRLRSALMRIGALFGVEIPKALSEDSERKREGDESDSEGEEVHNTEGDALEAVVQAVCDTYSSLQTTRADLDTANALSMSLREDATDVPSMKAQISSLETDLKKARGMATRARRELKAASEETASLRTELETAKKEAIAHALNVATLETRLRNSRRPPSATAKKRERPQSAAGSDSKQAEMQARRELVDLQRQFDRRGRELDSATKAQRAAQASVSQLEARLRKANTAAKQAKGKTQGQGGKAAKAPTPDAALTRRITSLEADVKRESAMVAKYKREAALIKGKYTAQETALAEAKKKASLAALRVSQLEERVRLSSVRPKTARASEREREERERERAKPSKAPEDSNAFDKWAANKDMKDRLRDMDGQVSELRATIARKDRALVVLRNELHARATNSQTVFGTDTVMHSDMGMDMDMGMGDTLGDTQDDLSFTVHGGTVQ
ncbi:hypothetical protein KIPB_004738, partial [Kipferlia bialata]